MRLLMVLVALLALPTVAPAVELVPLELRPISVSLTVTPSGGPGIPAFPGTSSASVSSDFQSGNFAGSIEVAISVEADGIRIDSSGVATSTDPSFHNQLDIQATVSVEIDVPMIGDAMTPVFVGLDNVIDQSDGWDAKFAGVSINFSSERLFGGKLRLEVRIFGGPSIPAETIGSFINSSLIRFNTLAPVLGTGDVNADGFLDILDVTLMRRSIVGLPLALAR